MMKPSKRFVIDRIREILRSRPETAILDIGSGRSGNFLALFEQFPHMRYVGLEPNSRSIAAARMHTGAYPNISFIRGRAYDPSVLKGEQFDLVVSLSVIEHVKNLKAFAAFTRNALVPGGRFIHLYDLGHALYPASLKERVQVWLCSRALSRRFIPEQKIARYIEYAVLVALFQSCGLQCDTTTYHNNPGIVGILKTLASQAPDAVYEKILRDAAAFERAASAPAMPQSAKEALFPAVCVWGRRMS